MKKTYSLVLSYEGSAFKGWHTQINAPTVQGTLNQTLSELYQQKIFTWGAGRTDSGAHALKYTAHYRVHKDTLPSDEIKLILNSKLPPEIRIYDVQVQDNKFHATFSCIARSYCYIVYTGEVLPPRFFRRTYHERQDLNFTLIQKCLPFFVGTHDFTQFCYGYRIQEKENKNMTRRVDSFRVKKQGDFLIYFIKGEGFLRGMIRTLIGSTLSVGKEIMSIDDIQKGLSGEPLPSHKWKPVPADGLYFKRAHYPVKE